MEARTIFIKTVRIRSCNSNFTYFGINSKFILYRYLQEIGYTDTIIDVRSNKVKAILGLNNNNNNNNNNNSMNNNNNSSTQDDSLPPVSPVGSQSFNGSANESNSRRSTDSQGSKNSKKVSSSCKVA